MDYTTNNVAISPAQLLSLTNLLLGPCKKCKGTGWSLTHPLYGSCKFCDGRGRLILTDSSPHRNIELCQTTSKSGGTHLYVKIRKMVYHIASGGKTRKMNDTMLP